MRNAEEETPSLPPSLPTHATTSNNLSKTNQPPNKTRTTDKTQQLAPLPSAAPLGCSNVRNVLNYFFYPLPEHTHTHTYIPHTFHPFFFCFLPPWQRVVFFFSFFFQLQKEITRLVRLLFPFSSFLPTFPPLLVSHHVIFLLPDRQKNILLRFAEYFFWDVFIHLFFSFLFFPTRQRTIKIKVKIKVIKQQQQPTPTINNNKQKKRRYKKEVHMQCVTRDAFATKPHLPLLPCRSSGTHTSKGVALASAPLPPHPSVLLACLGPVSSTATSQPAAHRCWYIPHTHTHTPLSDRCLLPPPPPYTSRTSNLPHTHTTLHFTLFVFPLALLPVFLWNSSQFFGEGGRKKRDNKKKQKKTHPSPND